VCCLVRSRMVDRCRQYVSAVAVAVWCCSDRSRVVDRCEQHVGANAAAVRCVSYRSRRLGRRPPLLARRAAHDRGTIRQHAPPAVHVPFPPIMGLGAAYIVRFARMEGGWAGPQQVAWHPAGPRRGGWQWWRAGYGAPIGACSWSGRREGRREAREQRSGRPDHECPRCDRREWCESDISRRWCTGPAIMVAQQIRRTSRGVSATVPSGRRSTRYAPASPRSASASTMLVPR
jgi:hypothetical protein